MDLRLQRVGAWCGIGMLILFGICFVLIGGLIPPLSPTSSAQQIAQFFIDHKLRVRLGVALTLLAVPAAMPWLAVICLRIRRIEGKWGLLSVTQVFAGVVFVPGFVFPLMVLGAAAYRPEHRPPEVTEALNDVFWLMLIGIVGPAIVQVLVMAAAAFLDGTDPPTFPRWFGYLNIWFALLALPGGAVVLFNDGPLAWNGVFAFWIPLAAFTIWMIAVTVVMLRSISAQDAAENRVVAPAA
jgi:hypothetical protein